MPDQEMNVQATDIPSPPGSSESDGGKPLAREKVRAQHQDMAIAWVAATVGGGVAISFLPDSLGAWRDLVPVVTIGLYLLFAVPRGKHGIPQGNPAQRSGETAHARGAVTACTNRRRSGCRFP